MRLWTQARQMGAWAARAMVDARAEQDFCFELFAHMTTFFGMKTVLLGRFNAQGLDPARCEAIVRTSPGVEYVKVVIEDGRVVGALLIGDTDLEVRRACGVWCTCDARAMGCMRQVVPLFAFCDALQVALSASVA